MTASQCHGFGAANPILRVANLNASIDYYVNTLGFKMDWEHKDLIAAVSRDRCCLFLSVGDQGNPGAWVWIGVDDVSVLFDEFNVKGANIRQSPTNFSWAFEMQITDLDGNILRLGSDPIPGKPFGPWCDMHGDFWDATPEGGWVRREGG